MENCGHWLMILKHILKTSIFQFGDLKVLPPIVSVLLFKSLHCSMLQKRTCISVYPDPGFHNPYPPAATIFSFHLLWSALAGWREVSHTSTRYSLDHGSVMRLLPHWHSPIQPTTSTQRQELCLYTEFFTESQQLSPMLWTDKYNSCFLSCDSVCHIASMVHLSVCRVVCRLSADSPGCDWCWQSQTVNECVGEDTWIQTQQQGHTASYWYSILFAP